LNRFGSLRGLYQTHVAEIDSVKGVVPQTSARLNAALAFDKKLNQWFTRLLSRK
jgi:DNA repair protein RadC